MMNLFRKELSELMNKQMLISLVVSFFIIMMIGTMMTTMITGQVGESGTVHVIDEDKSDFSRSVISLLEEKGYTVELGSDFETMMQTKNWEEAVVLPAGMEEAFARHESIEMPSYTLLRTTSVVKMSMSSANSADLVTAAIEKRLSETYHGEELAFLDDPVQTQSFTCANGMTVQANALAVVSSLAMFDQLMPLILFLLVVLTAQTIITAICSEKLDKTLETLLACPLPRSQIIGAKMLAALIVALTYTVVYGLGFLFAMMMNTDKVTGQLDVGATMNTLMDTREAVQVLGLQMPTIGWIGVIVQLALTLCIALTAAIILGAMTEDAKNAQSASLPIMLCTMFPYVLSMISDIRNMEGGLKWVMLAIPFTHTFIATGCLRFHDYVTFWGGMAYQAVFLVGMVWFALRLYSSDILFVHSRRAFRRKQKTE